MAGAGQNAPGEPCDGNDPAAYVVRCSCDPGPNGDGGQTVVDHIRLFARWRRQHGNDEDTPLPWRLTWLTRRVSSEVYYLFRPRQPRWVAAVLTLSPGPGSLSSRTLFWGPRMLFERVSTQVDFPAQERQILEFWEDSKAFEMLCEKNRNQPHWSFLDGPITANNPMGVHHAWGRAYKDAFHRYFAMTGHRLRYQNGFDCQGLWVEVEVERELNLKSKRDIESLVPGDTFASIDRFVQLCKDRVDRFAKVQTEQSIRLGYWMDWDRGEDWLKPPDQRRSYFTMSEENNFTIWAFLKKCNDRELIYRGVRRDAVVPAVRGGIEPDGGARRLSPGRPLGGLRPLPAAGPARREPAGLDDHSLDALEQRCRRRQARADVPQGAAPRPDLLRRQGGAHGQAARRGIPPQGVGRRSAQAQDAGADLPREGWI